MLARFVATIAILGLVLGIGLPPLIDKQEAELARIQPCPTEHPETKGLFEQLLDIGSLLHKGYDAVFGTDCENKVKALKAKAAEPVVYFKLLVLGLTPLVYIVLGRMPGLYSQIAGTVREASEQAQRHRAIREEEANKRKRVQALKDADHQERLRIGRAFIINKLGSASNYALHLADPAHQNQRLFILGQIGQELRDIVVKHPIPELKELVASHPELSMKFSNLRAALEQHSITNEDLELMISISQGQRR